MHRYTDVEFAVLNGTVVKFEEPFSNGTYNGPSDFSYTLKLKWDPTWLYVAVEVTDDLWEDVIESNGCYEHGLQLAIEVGGENATRADGKSELGLVQARRSDNLGQSRMVMINVAMSAGVTSCACVDCDTSSNAPANDQCCVTYENHGAPSPTAGTSFLQRLSLGIVRDEVAGKTFYEVAIHRGDIMYEDWPGRELSSASRWSAGTVMGFSMVANEGAEDSPEGPPTQHSWGGYYPHVRFQTHPRPLLLPTVNELKHDDKIFIGIPCAHGTRYALAPLSSTSSLLCHVIMAVLKIVVSIPPRRPFTFLVICVRGQGCSA
jgi:hypothetical protein